MLRRQRRNSWGDVNGQRIAKSTYCIGVLGCGRGKGACPDRIARGYVEDVG